MEKLNFRINRNFQISDNNFNLHVFDNNIKFEISDKNLKYLFNLRKIRETSESSFKVSFRKI